MENLESFEQKVSEYGKEIERIQKILENYFPQNEAKQVTKEIYDIILDVDENLNELLKDSEVLKQYTYDGNLFVSKDKPNSFYKGANGLTLLKSLSEDTLRSFNSGVNKAGYSRSPFILGALFGWLDSYADRTKFLLERWQSSKTFSTFSTEEIKEIIKRQREIDPPPLSDEERRIFDQYEKQMSEKDGEEDK